MSDSKALTVAGTSVHQINGLYSLTDLHKASGAEAKHRPNYFLDIDQTQGLIGEISKAGIPAFEAKRGNNGGTYACKELVIAYAAWISAAFHLKVIRVFLDVVQPQSEPVQMRLDYDRISPAQAQDLKEIVAAIVQAGVQTYGETWKRFQNKYQVNSYLELPLGVARHPASGSAPVFDCQVTQGLRGRCSQRGRQALCPAPTATAPLAPSRRHLPFRPRQSIPSHWPHH
ncbi:KilA-N domain-containing protein [Comamonas sp. CMM02]|nr:KilA-N domain-containing protein [Comamonas sp. CMM02]